MATIGTHDAVRLVVFSPLLAAYALAVVLFLTPYTLLSGRFLNRYEYSLGVAGLSLWGGAIAGTVVAI